MTVDRNTSAEKSISVTKTLVEGSCCQNSFGLESDLHFCSLENGATCVKGVNDLTTVERNSQFVAVWSIKDNDTSDAIKSFAFLFPDTIYIGPFLPDWEGLIDDTGRTADSSYWLSPSDDSSFAIVLQSNVAFTGNVVFTGRIWEKDSYGPGIDYPHDCFIKDG